MAVPGKCSLVSGPPGVGKTTLIIRVLESLKQSNPSLKAQGFYTREVRECAERVGFEVVTLDGRKGFLSSTKISSPESHRWPTVGRYRVDIALFESLALPELQDDRRREEKDERKHKYNVKWNDEVTPEDMEAYRMKRVHQDDPMKEFPH